MDTIVTPSASEVKSWLTALQAGCEQHGFNFDRVVSLIPKVSLGQPIYAYRRGQRVEKYYPTVGGHTVYVDPTERNHGDLTDHQAGGNGTYRPRLPKSDYSLAAWCAFVCPELKNVLSEKS